MAVESNLSGNVDGNIGHDETFCEEVLECFQDWSRKHEMIKVLFRKFKADLNKKMDEFMKICELLNRGENVYTSAAFHQLGDEVAHGLYRCSLLMDMSYASLYEANVAAVKILDAREISDQEKQSLSKIKATRVKKLAGPARDSIRNTDRDSRSVSLAKTKALPTSTASVPTNDCVSTTAVKKKLRHTESCEGRSLRKRGVGRPSRVTRRRQLITSNMGRVNETPKLPEELYCLCRQISYGDMVLCDNPDCNEWFHFACVQLKSKPKGKWYCPNCRGDRCDQPNPDIDTQDADHIHE